MHIDTGQSEEHKMKRYIKSAIQQPNLENYDELSQIALNTYNIRWIERCLQSEDYWIRNVLARNINLPREVFHELAEDDYKSVRAYLAENPAIPEDLLQKLANDNAPSVRFAVTHNPNVPNYMLDQLSRDYDSYVARHAKIVLNNRETTML